MIEPGYYWIKRAFCCLDWEPAAVYDDGEWRSVGSAASLYEKDDPRRFGEDCVLEIGEKIARKAS